MTTTSRDTAGAVGDRSGPCAAAPWYREPWPWFLMAGPLVVVLGGIVTAWLAVSSYDGLVADDYYKQGLAVNQLLARGREAVRLGIEGKLTLVAETDAALRLRSASSALPKTLRLALSHPTRAGLDQRITMSASSAGGVYAGRIAPLAAGRWSVIVEDESRRWRIRGELNVPNEREAQLRHGH